MGAKPLKTQPGKILPFNTIRVEAELSKYPIHNLDKGSTAVEIQIVKKNDHGEVTLQWLVSHSSRYGQPGQLAYKIDTLVINRRLDESGRPLPKCIRLGSLRQIASDVGVGEKNTGSVKKALRQNAHTGITAKLFYRDLEGGERKFEGDFHRYSVVFTGETLPDGQKADAVYLVFNDIYRKFLNNSLTRPLDYDYLKVLSPTAQRLYEIVSYQVFAALKHNLPYAKMRYSDWCLYSARQRYFKRKKMLDQMRKIHHPHLESGYFTEINYQETVDAEGNPDWYICYTPGGKARNEYNTFNNKRQKVIEIERVDSSWEQGDFLQEDRRAVSSMELDPEEEYTPTDVKEFQRSLFWDLVSGVSEKLSKMS